MARPREPWLETSVEPRVVSVDARVVSADPRRNWGKYSFRGRLEATFDPSGIQNENATLPRYAPSVSFMALSTQGCAGRCNRRSGSLAAPPNPVIAISGRYGRHLGAQPRDPGRHSATPGVSSDPEFEFKTARGAPSRQPTSPCPSLSKSGVAMSHRGFESPLSAKFVFGPDSR